MNEPVTSVSKREQKPSDVAAALTVLTNDDLRHSGATPIAVPRGFHGSITCRF